MGVLLCAPTILKYPQTPAPGCESVGRVPKQRRACVGPDGDVSQEAEAARRGISRDEGYWIWQSRAAGVCGLHLDVGACGD